MFKEGSALVRGLNLLTEIFIINILTEIGLIPLAVLLLIVTRILPVTAFTCIIAMMSVFSGIFYTAMHYCIIKIIKAEEGYTFSAFIKACKINFKQSLIMGIEFISAFMILFADACIMKAHNYAILSLICYAFMLPLYFCFLYAFPLQARFYNPIKTTVKNALLLSFLNFPKTLLMLLLHILCSILLHYFHLLSFPLLVIFGIAFIAYIRAHIYIGVITDQENKLIK